MSGRPGRFEHPTHGSGIEARRVAVKRYGIRFAGLRKVARSNRCDGRIPHRL